MRAFIIIFEEIKRLKKVKLNQEIAYILSIKETKKELEYMLKASGL